MTMRHGSRPATLDAIESASQGELRTLQLQRMKWSVKHAYDNVPHYRTVFDAAGVMKTNVTGNCAAFCSLAA